MSSAARQRKIQELMEKTAEALGRGAIFECERLAVKAFSLARQEADFELMSKIVAALQQARTRRFEQALTAAKGKLTIIDTPVPDDVKVKPGCYLVQPPQVGADARRLRFAALQGEVCAVVLCREPVTRTGLQPIVAISPRSTVRAKVDPPDDVAAPDLEWFTNALEALGNAAIEDLDPELSPAKRIEALIDRLDAIPEHQNLHLALAAACREAQRQSSDETEAAPSEPAASPAPAAPSASPTSSRTKQKTAASE